MNLTEEEIFAAAVQKPLTERAAFLDRACAGNTSLRAQVEALLAAHDKPDSLLDVPTGNVTIDLPPRSTEGPGTQIGPYKLLQKLGEGGMGTVWVAEQERPVKRRVALKVIKPGMDSAQVIARFEAERQALAIMDHTCIAKVLDAGTTDAGRLYFIMELVKGVPITKYCDELNLPIRERLALFVPVCQAIQHAHQKGIIHRDLKPSNILVAMQDGRPMPKVIDFGIAKALHQPLTERTMMTEFGAVVGTLEYMSPEQAELSALDIDTRADIYALGVLLYELLTGTTPLDRSQLRAAALDEMLRMIREDEPPRPSTRLSSSDNLPSLAAHRRSEPRKLGAEVRGELDWIVMKALEKDRTRRYETASSFARDIDRYLSDEPVEACPPSTAYRLRKFAKKHFAVLSTAAAFALVLVAASIVSTALAIRAKRAEEQATIQRDIASDAAQQAKSARVQAESDRDRALTAEQLASERLAQVTTEKERAQRAETLAADEAAIAKAVNEFLQNDLLGQANLYTQDRHALPPDREVKLRTVVDRAAARVSGRFTDQPLVESALRLTIGQVYFSLGEYGPAREHLQRALDIREQALGMDHLDTLAAAYAMATLCAWDAKLAQGEQLFQQVIAARRKALGSEHPDTLTALWGLGELYSHSGKYAQQEPLVLEVLEGRRKVLGEEHPDTLSCKLCQAMLHALKGDFDKAESQLLKVLESQRKVLGNEHPSTLMTAGNLGWVYGRAKRPNDAERVLAQNFEDERSALGPDHPLTLGTQHNLAATYWGLGKLNLAEHNYRESLERGRKILGSEHELIQKNLEQLARFYQEQKKDDLAEPLLVELRNAYQKSGPDNPVVASASTNLASSLIRQQRAAEAEPLLRESLAIFEQKAPNYWMRYYAQDLLGAIRLEENNCAAAEPLLLQGYDGMKQRETTIPERQKPRVAEALDRLVQLYEDWRKKDEAILATVLRGPGKYEATEASVKSALDACRSTRPVDDILTLAVMKQLAVSYRAAARWPEAVPLYEELLKAEQTRWGPTDAHTLTAANSLGDAYVYAGQLDKAEPLLTETLERRRELLGESHVATVLSIHNLAWLRDRQGKYEESAKIYERAVEGRLKTSGPDHDFTMITMNNLALVYQKQNRFDQAAELFGKVLGVRRRKLGPEHTSTLATLSNLALVYQKQGKLDQADELYRQVLDARRRTLGPEHPFVATAQLQLARNLLNQQMPADAAQLLRECLAIREGNEPDKSRLLNAKSLLGAAYIAQQKFTDAEPLLLDAYEGLKRDLQSFPTEAKGYLSEALQRLIELYTAWDKPYEAAKFLKILEERKTAQ